MLDWASPRSISIHGWDKTTSGSGKRAAVILEFCFLFRFWWKYSYRDDILYLLAKFRSNRTIGGGVMTSYRFYNMADIESEIVRKSLERRKSICITKFRWYLNRRLRLNYFRFRKTDCQDIGIQFPLSISTIGIGMLFCICLPNFIVMGRSSYRFFKSRTCASGFRFSDGICLRRWKSICIPNFDE